MTQSLPNGERERLDALRRYAILDTPPEEEFDDAAHLAARACGTPIALVSLVDADRLWFKARVGLDAAEAPRAGSFCADAIARLDLLVVPDAEADARFAGHSLVTGRPPVRFYAGAPLCTRDGFSLGTLCVMDHVPRQLSPEQAEILRILSRRAVGQLEQRLASKCRRTLLEINNAIVSNLQLGDLLHALCHALALALPFDRAALTLYSADRDAFRILAFEAREPSAGFRVGTEVPRKDSPLGWVFERRQLLLRRDLEREQEFAVERRLVSEGVRSLCMAPLLVGSRIIGTLNVGSYTRHEYTPAHAAFLQEVANQVALAVANAQAYEEITALKARLQAENVYLKEEIRSEHNFEEIVGRSPALLEALRKVEKVALTDATVLIFGETGTGKELFARAIHNRSPRRERPLVKVNCGAIAPGLVESELFGHLKGAFTGALQNRTGRFELADGGTLFLDEVSELLPETQVKLLRVLQEQEFEPVGSSRTVKVDVRVIAASNRELENSVREGKFRADLLYRLNVFPLKVPPLRERRSDIPLLVNFFLGRLSKRLGKPLEGVSERGMRWLASYSWPGNIRELQNVIERAAILERGPLLELDGEASQGPAPAQLAEPVTLEGLERAHIVQTLESTDWIVEGPRGAATILGIHPNTLRSRMKRLGIARPPHEVGIRDWHHEIS